MIGAAVLALALVLFQGGASDPKKVVGRIGAEVVTLADVEAAAGEELERIDLEHAKKRHALLEAALRNWIETKLLEREAGRRGKSPHDLLAEEVESKVKVTDADVDAWYEANRPRLEGRAKESIAPGIRRYLVEQAREKARRAFFETLEKDAGVAYLLEPFRVPIEVEGHPARGPARARVTIVEFSDFECPYCANFNETLRQVRQAFPDDVRVVFRQYPLPIHANAQKAAEASLCAAEQGRFWEMHDLMFAEPKALGVAELKEKAGRVGLESVAFADCLDSGRNAARVEEDVRLGTRIGVTGTPAIFLNGRPLRSGAIPFEELKTEIALELAQ
jgi:predicted DsbA family dithiol-disulfide isomerase